MHIMESLAKRNSELARAYKQERVKLVRNVFNRDRRLIQAWIDPRNSNMRDFDPHKFALWQGRHRRRILDGCDFVVAFLGESPGWNARFIGVYENKTPGKPKRHPEKFDDAVKHNNLAAELADHTRPALLRPGLWLYELHIAEGFSDLEKPSGGLCVNWPGRNPYLWAHENPMKVIPCGGTTGR